MDNRALPAAAALAAILALPSCGYVKLLRPNTLKQLSPEMVALVNELHEVDDPNKAIVARLFAHGGLSHAEAGDDGVFRDEVAVPLDEYIWRPAIIVMKRAGRLELTVSNEDQVHHMMFVPDIGERRLLDLPVHTRGRVTVNLDQPGLYWFGCPVANHAGRGMLGLVLVKGEVPPEAKLDRPRQPRP